MAPVLILRSLARLSLVAAAIAGCARSPPPGPTTTPDAAPVASPTTEHGDATLASLSWLSGTWTSATPVGPVTVEHWLAPAGGTMLGVNRTVFEGRTVFFEYLRIEGEADRILYLASPLGRDPPTPFSCIERGPGVVVFENPDHDYPQRIEYRRQGDELRMTISGVDDGEAKSSQWTMVRAPTPDQAHSRDAHPKASRSDAANPAPPPSAARGGKAPI